MYINHAKALGPRAKDLFFASVDSAARSIKRIRQSQQVDC